MLVLDDPDNQISQVETLLQDNDIQVQSHREIKFSLEDVFISIVDQARQRGLNVATD